MQSIKELLEEARKKYRVYEEREAEKEELYGWMDAYDESELSDEEADHLTDLRAANDQLADELDDVVRNAMARYDLKPFKAAKPRRTTDEINMLRLFTAKTRCEHRSVLSSSGKRIDHVRGTAAEVSVSQPTSIASFGAVDIHTHPNNHPPSCGDLATFLNNRQSSMYVVTPNNVYVLKRTPKTKNGLFDNDYVAHIDRECRKMGGKTGDYAKTEKVVRVLAKKYGVKIIKYRR